MSTSIDNTTVLAGPSDLQKLLERYKSQIEMVIPRHLTPERMIRVAMTAYSRTPALRECTGLSIIACVIQASELGLDLTGPLGQAYMVPFRNKNIGKKEAQFVVGYRGYIALAYRSAMVKTFHPHEVRAKDYFEYEYGTDPRIVHKPLKSGDRGEVTHVYAVLLTKDGGIDFEVMSRADIEAHREQYSKQRSDGAFNPWNTAWSEMAKKTPMRRLFKRAPVSIEAQVAAGLDEAADLCVPQDLPLIDTANLAPGAPEGRQDLSHNGAPGATSPPPGDAPRRATVEQVQRLDGLAAELALAQDDLYRMCAEHGADRAAIATLTSAYEIFSHVPEDRAASLITMLSADVEDARRQKADAQRTGGAGARALNLG